MMLWNIIRDWFVMNIWGGCTSDYRFFGGTLLSLFHLDDGHIIDEGPYETNAILLKLNMVSADSGVLQNAYISIGDWLSTMSTIIVLIALCFFFFLMVRWLFRLTAGLIQGRG